MYVRTYVHMFVYIECSPKCNLANVVFIPSYHQVPYQYEYYYSANLLQDTISFRNGQQEVSGVKECRVGKQFNIRLLLSPPDASRFLNL